MSKLPVVSGKELCKILGKAGYLIDHQTGSHIILYHPNKPILSIPDHKEVAPPLLRAQIARAGLTIEELLKAKRK